MNFTILRLLFVISNSKKPVEFYIHKNIPKVQSQSAKSVKVALWTKKQ